MGITSISPHACQVALEAGRTVVLDVEGMPQLLGGCLLPRHDTALSDLSAVFREFVLVEGPRLTACRVH